MIIDLSFYLINIINKEFNYRVYLDKELITERTFFPDYNGKKYKIHETVRLLLSEGEHTLSIQKVDYPEPLPNNCIQISNLSIFDIKVPEAEGKTSFTFYI